MQYMLDIFKSSKNCFLLAARPGTDDVEALAGSAFVVRSDLIICLAWAFNAVNCNCRSAL